MPLVALDKIPQVAVAFINDDHREEAQRLNDLADAVRGHQGGKVAVETVLHRLEALHEHTQEHFAREEEAMKKARFPPFPVHKAEHDRVLEEMESEETHFRETGDTARLWRYVADVVPSWFVSHIQSMDQVTAAFVSSPRA